MSLVDQCRAFKREEWEVRDAPLQEGRALVAQHHYAKGGSNTAVYMHGLYREFGMDLFGVAWWLPPTRVACESVNRQNWKQVLSLTRLVILPEVPPNGATYLIAQSIKRIRREKRFVSLVTYADESQGHTGTIYKAGNWTYVGRTGPYPRWLDSNGRQVACKATFNRTKAVMESLGHRKVGSYFKHKFVMHL